MPALATALLAALPTALPTVLVVDFSTSMIADSGGVPRMERLGNAAAELLADPQREIGVLAFGHRQADSCADLEWLAQPGARDPGAALRASAELRKLRAQGKAPLAEAVALAATKLPRRSPSLLVLAVDGEDNCGGNLERELVRAQRTRPLMRIRVLGLGMAPPELDRLARGAAAARLTPLPAGADYGEALIQALDSRRQRALLYVLSDGADSRGWYRQPSDLERLQTSCAAAGIELELRDRRSLPRLSQSRLDRYEQIWILEADFDDAVEVSPAEADLLLGFFGAGGGIWVSLESAAPTGAWAEDADALLAPFGVGFGGNVLSYSGPKPIAGDHPLLSGIGRLYLDEQFAFLWTGPDAAAEPIYRAGGKPVIVAMDGRPSGHGRLVADGGWILGWLIGRRRIGREQVQESDNRLFLRNVAEWLGR